MTVSRVDWRATHAGARRVEAAAPRPMSTLDALKTTAWCLVRRRLAWLAARARELAAEQASLELGAVEEAAFAAWCADDPVGREEAERIAAAEHLVGQASDRLTRLCAALGLDEGARFALEVMVALSSDGSLREELGRLAARVGEPGLSERLLRLLGGPEGPSRIGMRALADWGIVFVGAASDPTTAASAVDPAADPVIDPFIAAYVCGAADDDPALAGIATVV
ncbi:MAG TPA: hypothetical protein VHO06_11270, partial [Polyangia bacterium]|nr:hypothetical protein [Polyangia bacterium]